MRILIVAATAAELAPCLPRLQSMQGVEVLVTGVGMVAMAARCARALAKQPYDLVLNFGVCGSFKPSLPTGTAVHVVSDSMPELGAEDGDAFLTLEQLRLAGPDDFPFRGGRLVNKSPHANAAVRTLPAVRAITVNTVHGNDQSIAEVRQRHQPEVESMEGAGFMYACLVEGVPFAQIRAVSNVVERRNREAWKLKEAIDSLGAAALNILDSI